MMVKRGLDFVAALLALVLLGPGMALAALLIYATMGRPVLYRQLRPGLKGRPFMLYKLRTMTNSTDTAGTPLPDAERLTRVGRFMRRYSADELPQLFNVLRGDMSLVGPRPLLMEYLSLYSRDQARRHEVRPGITGWAQVNGRNAQSWEERFRLDVWYVNHQSLGLDLKILWLTLRRILRARDISRIGHATMPRFTGSNGERRG